METPLMHLKVLLPHKIFKDLKNVKRVVAETSCGSYGLLPQRLDCTAALDAGILLYETVADGVKYIALDEGILVKRGSEVLVSVRNAMGDAPLGKLKELVESELKLEDEKTLNIRSVMAKLESSFMRGIQRFKKE